MTKPFLFVTAMLLAALAAATAAGAGSRQSEALYLSLTLGRTTGSGTFVAFGPVNEAGQATGTFKQAGKPATTVAGTNTLTGKAGKLTLRYQGPDLPASPPPTSGNKPPAYIVNFGTWSVTTATGSFAPLAPAKGTFAATITNQATTLHAGFYSH